MNLASRYIGIQSLEFKHTQRVCKDRFGNIAPRWLPYGMPRILPEVESCSFFLVGLDETGKLVGPGGTGFIVARDSSVGKLPDHYYAVTNWHVAVQGGYSIIRMNQISGGSRCIEFEPDEWKFKKEYDLAVIDITDHLDSKKDNFHSVPEKHFVDRGFIKKVERAIPK